MSHRRSQPPGTRRCRSAARGFTLIELVIAVTIVGILATVAYPSFMNQVRKARRSDAMDFASRIQQLQERYRVNNTSYAASIAALGLASGASSSGYYTLTSAAGAGGAAGSAYTVTAVAVAGTSQASDTTCTTMIVTLSAGVLSYTPAACWGR